MVLSVLAALGVRLRRWVLLEGNRLVVSAGLLVLVYLVLDPMGHWVPDLFGVHFGSPHRVTELLNALLGGIFLLVSIVVTIASLFVTQEQGPLSQQFNRVQEAGELRQDIEDAAGVTVTPTMPDEYLYVLADAIVTKAGRLESAVGEAEADTTEELRQKVDTYLHEMADQTRRLRDDIEADASTLSLVLATLDYDHVLLSNQLRQLRAEHDDTLPAEADETAEQLQQLLRHFAATREYFKTLYFSREFATLSKHLIYVSLPAIVLVSFVLLHASDFPNTHTSTAVVATISLAPFALLSAYVLRVATVATRTRSTGRFRVEDHDGDRVFDLDRPGK